MMIIIIIIITTTKLIRIIIIINNNKTNSNTNNNKKIIKTIRINNKSYFMQYFLPLCHFCAQISDMLEKEEDIITRVHNAWCLYIRYVGSFLCR